MRYKVGLEDFSCFYVDTVGSFTDEQLRKAIPNAIIVETNQEEIKMKIEETKNQEERKMKLQIEKRKNTTKKAITELQKIVAEINTTITDDVRSVDSDPFDAKVSGTDVPKAFWQIRGGLLALREYDDDAFDINFSDIIRLNFERAVLMLEQVVEKYNKIASEKDEELQKFLNSCEKFWSEKQ
jgi:hypothetical protein